MECLPSAWSPEGRHHRSAWEGLSTVTYTRPLVYKDRGPERGASSSPLVPGSRANALWGISLLEAGPQDSSHSPSCHDTHMLPTPTQTTELTEPILTWGRPLAWRL